MDCDPLPCITLVRTTSPYPKDLTAEMQEIQKMSMIQHDKEIMEVGEWIENWLNGNGVEEER